MRLLWQSFLHEPFHEPLFLFVAGENGIHERDAVVLGVQLCNFVPAGQQGHVDAAAVGDELEQLCFGLTEAVDRDLCAVAALRQAWGIPEHRIAGIKDRCHPHKFQCPAVAEDTKVVEMPIRIRQHEIREDLIFQKTSYFQLRQTMLCADMNEMLGIMRVPQLIATIPNPVGIITIGSSIPFQPK